MGKVHPTLDDLAPVHALLADDFPELLREAGEVLYLELLVAEAKPPEPSRCQQLAQTALAQVVRLSELLGGTQPYWPSAKYFVMSERNLQMCAEFRGDYTALARKYNLSEIQVRNIVDGWQKKKFMARQGALPGLE